MPVTLEGPVTLEVKILGTLPVVADLAIRRLFYDEHETGEILGAGGDGIASGTTGHEQYTENCRHDLLGSAELHESGAPLNIPGERILGSTRRRQAVASY